MNNLDQVVQQIAGAIGLDAAEIAQRKKFLELAEDDIARLRKVHEQMRSFRHRFADAFYEHLGKFKSIQPLLKGRLEQLKNSQSAYFDSLTAGEYGPDYVNERVRVGVVHQRIGLEPQWYLGAYRKYLAEMQAMLWKLLGDEPEEYLLTFDALLKVVNFDVGLALDTYFQVGKQEILESQEYVEQIVSMMPSGLMVLNEDQLILSINPAMRAMFSLGDDVSSSGMALSTLVKSKPLQDAAAEVLANGAGQCHILITLPSGDRIESPHRIEFSITSIHRRGKKLLMIMAENATARLEAEAQLAQSEERYRLTFSHAAVGLAQVAPNGSMLHVNQKLCQILGYEQAELLGMNFQQLTHPDELSTDMALIYRLMAGEIENYNREKRCLHKDGHVVWVKVAVSQMRDASGQLSFISVFEDISQRHRLEMELTHLAHHDPLTSLPNRLLLHDRLAHALANAKRSSQQVAVMFVDLDRFKNINDSLGHVAGDIILVEVARRFVSNIRNGDTVARIGGDEFVIVLEGLGAERAEAIIAMRAQAMLNSLIEPIVIESNELYTSASIGVAIYPQDGGDSETLMRNADAAMYLAKEAGRSNFRFYAKEMNDRSLHRLRLGSSLPRALEKNELLLHYHPIIDVRSGRIVCMEALLRWRRSDGVMIPPNEFISIAEETGLIVPIGAWVLQHACHQLAQWRRDGLVDIRVAINLSVRQFKNHDIIRDVSQALQQTGCPANALELEITESILMEDPDMMIPALHQLSNMGVHLSIDDFGTGYSSLAYLKRFPIDVLKIDQSFVRDITNDESDTTIVKAVIALAHNLKLKVVAEGVETAEQLTFLRSEGCDRIQGYFFSKAVPADQAEELLFLQQAGQSWSAMQIQRERA